VAAWVLAVSVKHHPPLKLLLVKLSLEVGVIVIALVAYQRVVIEAGVRRILALEALEVTGFHIHL
jgi:hypothetical protein